MPGKSLKSSTLSRRDFCVATAAAVTAAAVPLGEASAQTPAKYHRLNVSNPKAAPVLESYKKAIRAMLALPPTDPRNWYRNALVHALDCPHGNWWFLPWHRGYLGWFEQTCRELSGDPDFAIPYWDWTKEPRVPDVMFKDVLTPTDSAYIAKYDEFKGKFQEVVAKADYWKRVFTNGAFDERTQYGQLLYRGIRFPEDLWFDVIDDPRGKFFFDLVQARGLTKEKPEFDERTSKAVLLSNVLDALSPRDFLTFASPRTLFHSGLTGFGVLEGQPHNRVHNNVGGISFRTVGGVTTRIDVGGFMQANLSPVDPIFFLHHSNMDRLWDVWTRKQQAHKYPILPEGPDFEPWSTEPFLFFVDSEGKPVTKTNAGDYAAIGDFSYDYEVGSGEEFASSAVAATATTPTPPQVQAFRADIADPWTGPAKAAGGAVVLPSALLQTGRDVPKLFAKITVALPPLAHADDYSVVIGGADRNPAEPQTAIPLSIFGHHLVHGPVTFTVPLSRPLAALRTSNQLAANTPLNIRVVSEERLMPHTAMATRGQNARAEVLSIVVEAH